MKRYILKYLIIILSITIKNNAKAQGCSDAGFCTINSFKPQTSDSSTEMKSQFKVGLSYGSADYSISAIGNYIEYNRALNKWFTLDVKLSSLSQNGNDISVIGISDVYLNTNYNLNENLKMTVGIKIPLTDGNRKKDNLSLPMDYQSSLGTLDLIMGVGYQIGNLQFIAAIQHPLTQNSNEFIAEDYPGNSKLREFQSTNKFKRSGDILLRASYPITLNNKLDLTLSILPIYHLNNDKYTDTLGEEIVIDGSQGLTLNGNVYLDYSIDTKNVLQLNAGAPFIVRDARPDGLTRSFIVNLEYRIKF